MQLYDGTLELAKHFKQESRSNQSNECSVNVYLPKHNCRVLSYAYLT